MKKFLFLSLMFLPSCATVFQGNAEKVSVRLDPDMPGKCHLTQRHDPAQDFAVPAEISVARSYYPMEVTCSSNTGGKKGEARVYSDVSSLGFVGAIASVGVGTLVDSTTGDAFDYPAQIVVKLGQSIEIGRDSINNNVEFDKNGENNEK